jgi:hypothetical protein
MGCYNPVGNSPLTSLVVDISSLDSSRESSIIGCST